MWKGSNMGQKPKFHVEEEENKVRKNLSRLIHTLQHFPSNRLGLDTASLQNLVEDIESFNLEKKAKSMNFTQTTERKTYSKKYFNFKVGTSSYNKDISQRTYKIDKKFKNYESEGMFSDGTSSGKFSHSKKKVFETSNLPSKSSNSSNKNKYKSFSCNTGDKMKTPTFNTKEVIKRNVEENNASKSIHSSGQNQRKSENKSLQIKNKLDYIRESNSYPLRNARKDEKLCKTRWKTNDTSKQINSRQKYLLKNKIETKFPSKESSLKPNNQNKYQVLNFKSNIDQCSQKSNRPFKKIIFENNSNISAIDHCSMVKKLTNYWNCLLNNEFEECSITSESSGKCNDFESCEQLTLATHNNETDTSSEISGLTMKSQKLPESNIKEVISNERSFHCEQDDSNSNQKVPIDSLPNKKCTSLNEDLIPGYTSGKCSSVKVTDNDDSCKVLEDERNYDFEEDAISSKMEVKPNLNAGDVIEELQKLLYTLKSFPTCDILSTEISLPQPIIKKILYVMTRTALIPQDARFLKKLEVYVDEMIREIKESDRCINGSATKTSKRVTNEIIHDISPPDLLPAQNQNLSIETQYIYRERNGYKQDVINNAEQLQKKCLLLKNSQVCDHENGINESQKFIYGNEIAAKPENSLVISRISFNEVQNALQFFNKYKEVIWSKLALKSPNYDYFDFSNYGNPPLHSFTVICEEDIFFEGDYSDEDDGTQSDVDSEAECETRMDMYRTIAAIIEKYFDTVIGTLENYWPHSPKTLIRMIYQALVSILIWKIILKDMFEK